MQCPGQDSRYWSGDDIFETKCPKCGHGLEFFKDDAKRKCKGCGFEMLNPHINFGCAEYCPHAEQCLGSLPEGLRPTGRAQTLKDRVSAAMQDYFSEDTKRIRHAEAVADFAEQINKYEHGDPAVVMACGYLHDIGIKNRSEVVPEAKDQSAAAKQQHIDGPPVARMLLESLDVEPVIIDEVCDIIGHHHTPRANESINFQVVYDADFIVHLDDDQPKSQHSKEKIMNMISQAMLTESGKKIAQAHFNVK
jgi:HD superfamily phosphohydrolase YqeK